jgi:hypothetical protein
MWIIGFADCWMGGALDEACLQFESLKKRLQQIERLKA